MTTKKNIYERRREDGELQLIYNSLNYKLSVVDKNGKAPDFNVADLSFPVRVVGEITSRCNQRCPNCSQKDNPRWASMNLDCIFRMIDEADKFHAFELSLRGAEATLHSDFDEVWNYATQKEFISTDLVTNGLVLNEQHVLSMLRNKRSKIVVSLDGFEEVNSVTRSPNQYSKVIRWLLPILAQKPEQITVLTTVSRYNYPYVDEFAGYLSQHGLRYHNLTLLKKLGDQVPPSLGFLSLQEMYCLEKSVAKIAEKNLCYAPTITSPFFSEQRDMLSGIPIQLFTEYYCGAGMKIMNDGRVGISQMIHFDQLSNSTQWHLYQKDKNCLGRLSEDKSLQEIWLDNKQLRAEQAIRAKKNYKYFLGLESHL